MTELTAHKATAYMQTTPELLDDSIELWQAMQAQQARWEAMTPEERRQERAERELQAALAKAARTCQHCGCDPDEHGGY